MCYFLLLAQSGVWIFLALGISERQQDLAQHIPPDRQVMFA